jgi:cytochrome c biogenesis protein CcdA
MLNRFLFVIAILFSAPVAENCSTESISCRPILSVAKPHSALATEILNADADDAKKKKSGFGAGVLFVLLFLIQFVLVGMLTWLTLLVFPTISVWLAILIGTALFCCLVWGTTALGMRRKKWR